jgi:hypothetical protein
MTLDQLSELRERVITWAEEYDKDLQQPHMAGFARRNISARDVQYAHGRGITTAPAIWEFICDLDGD